MPKEKPIYQFKGNIKNVKDWGLLIDEGEKRGIYVEEDLPEGDFYIELKIYRRASHPKTLVEVFAEEDAGKGTELLDFKSQE